MQVTGVWIWEATDLFSEAKWLEVAALDSVVTDFDARSQNKKPSIKQTYEFTPMSLNDICCMIPPWFGTYASIFTGLLAYEISRSASWAQRSAQPTPLEPCRTEVNAGVAATLIMAVIPAHLMRSVGGEFDNEAVAVTAICSTFWLWLLCVRTPRHWPISVLAGLSYFYMVAAWGGYIFVINMVGLHAGMLAALGRFNSGGWRS
eukprot:Skav220878  [mRNA]  locus=scaffold2625:40678:43767:+ [translate_table: standard]